MALTVKKVAAMAGVSVRTLHFYHERGLLKPAYTGANGYRYYDEPQLLILQQILFYRELGFELKRIKRILKGPNFEKVAALQSHRKVLQKNLTRTRRLIETIDKTIEHLKGSRKMMSEEMFAGFTVAAGGDRFGEQIKLGDAPLDCKVSGKDTNGAMAIFEFIGGWAKHLHFDQDEWVYVLDGEVELELGGKRMRVGAGESVFLPRKTPHVWSIVGLGKVINIYQPAGKMEDFFRAVSKKAKDLPTAEQVVEKTYTDEQVATLHELFGDHGMDLLGPPLIVEP